MIHVCRECGFNEVIDVTDLIKRSRAERAERDASVSCDKCTGLACGDECDGNRHATTERMCETCDGTGAVRKTPGDAGNDAPYKLCPDCKGLGTKPRPAAQDADELSEPVWPMCGGCALNGKQMDGANEHPHAVCSSCKIVDGKRTKWRPVVKRNRRPSLPMSAEVDRIVEASERLITEATLLWHGTPSESLRAHIEDFRAAIAALKEGHK
jgi:DnaJ-class molecular chaperone